jgi:UDP-hydrolysing UDP-N-acetyl-D-glucosamine 2-epimerase
MGTLALKIVIVTGSRADWNGLGMVAKALKEAGDEVDVVATAQQVEGDTAQAIYDDGFSPHLVDFDNYGYGARQLVGVAGRGVTRVGMTLDTLKPDMTLVGGDRFETLSAAFAASLLGIPIVHLAGGDVTKGSKDDRFRDAITALACVHCVTNYKSFRRLFGSATRRSSDDLVETGSPSIDRIKATPVLTREQTFEALKLEAGTVNIMVSVHPNSLSATSTDEAAELVRAVDALPEQVRFVCLGANADAGHKQIDQILQLLCASRYPKRGVFIKNVVPQLYFSMMTHFDMMMGNSSAAYYEAPSFGLPCVDIGDRQQGRIRARNIITVPASRDAILRGYDLAIIDGLSPVECVNPYGDGDAAERIVKAIHGNSWRCKAAVSRETEFTS